VADPILRSERLDPEARAILEKLDAEGAPPLEAQIPAQVRPARMERAKLVGGAAVPLARVEDIAIPGADGPIPARLYAAHDGGIHPALVYFHGGGFVFGNLETHDTICRALAHESGAVVISVDYRLAPEHKFPAAVEDAYAATLWVAANAPALGIDARRIAVGGDSAGANLATVVAIRCRDAGGPPLAAQVLLYPVTDSSSLDKGSYLEFAQGYGLTRAAMDWFGKHYLGSAEDGRNPEASPLLAPNLAGLPPALVITAEFDPLRDEGEEYAERLRQAGVAVTFERYAGMIHGFVAMRGVISGGDRAIRQAAGFLRDLDRLAR
jgi:acetyl esterase